MIESNLKNGKEEGLFVGWHENGIKMTEGNYKDGKEDGLWVSWHKNGQKQIERHYKDGIKVENTEKFLNRKGEPIDAYEEAE